MAIDLAAINVRLSQGRSSEAFELMWALLAAAIDTDDVQTISAIAGLADRVRVKGELRSSQEALKLIGAINKLPASLRSDRAAVASLPMTTGNDLPGYEITDVLGPVFGLTVRSRDALTQLGAKIKGGTLGGELRGMTDALEHSRIQVMHRMEGKARALGADGIIAVRFDASEMANVWTEICAYGTAVKARQLSDVRAGQPS